VFDVNADTEARAKGHEAEDKDQKADKAQPDPDPGNDFGVKQLLTADERPPEAAAKIV
jgi:hypothetical protein